MMICTYHYRMDQTALIKASVGREGGVCESAIGIGVQRSTCRTKVSGVIIHCVHACSIYPESPVVNDDGCRGTLCSECM